MSVDPYEYIFEAIESINGLEKTLKNNPNTYKPIPKEKIPKENFLRKIIDYFTEKSYPWLDYSDDKIKYMHPRTFLGDIENIKNYFSNLFSKKY